MSNDCPRCEGQRYDKGSCSLCGNLGVLCPDCAGRLVRTAVYSSGYPTYRCTGCAVLVADESGEPVSAGKLIPLVGSPETRETGRSPNANTCPVCKGTQCLGKDDPPSLRCQPGTRETERHGNR